MLNTYIGQKGYTIPKNILSEKDLRFIKKELTIHPQTHGGPVCSMFLDEVTYAVYRESPNKIYVPRYFGIKHFGNPSEIKLTEGKPIIANFCGTLRENQQVVVDTYMGNILSGGGGGLLELPCSYGKTVLSINIISVLKRKTLIIVHKEFLLNQWIERIGQFLPDAKVGRIQGQIIDVEGKDIVIGMLQSLSMKEYDPAVFCDFGLTIIDEVHHISSQVFSQALFKIVTRCMLGLSATMNRKDGTTHVFKMFIGDVIYKGDHDEKREVTVRAITYEIDDEDFNSVVTDYRGNVQYSTMISKLCAFNRRSDFILRVLSDMLLENSKQQIMILAHNKCLLKYLYDAIEYRQLATVGYYVGGMKEKDLKLTETKQVIIATYSMASEALDIKTLTTLFMATPKTDIEQAVGRILREKHSDPVIVDFVDKHKPFQGQWAKRKAFYKKQNYKIIQTSSLTYSPDISQWNKSRKMKSPEDYEDMGKCYLKF